MTTENSKKPILSEEHEEKFCEIGTKIKYIQTLMKILDAINVGDIELENHEYQHFVCGIKKHIDNLEEMYDKFEVELGI